MTAVNGLEYTTTGEADARPSVDIDLTDVRSRITDLHAESIGLATELLAVLGPLQRYVAQALDQAPGATTREGTGASNDIDVIELTRGFADSQQAVLEINCPSGTGEVVLDLSHISF